MFLGEPPRREQMAGGVKLWWARLQKQFATDGRISILQFSIFRIIIMSILRFAFALRTAVTSFARSIQREQLLHFRIRSIEYKLRCIISLLYQLCGICNMESLLNMHYTVQRPIAISLSLSFSSPLFLLALSTYWLWLWFRSLINVNRQIFDYSEIGMVIIVGQLVMLSIFEGIVAFAVLLAIRD